MKKWVIITAIVITAVLCVISWFLLPREVIVQYGMDGSPSNTMPKVFAILLPAVLSAIGIKMFSGSESDRRKKGIFITIIGYVAFILSIVFNR